MKDLPRLRRCTEDSIFDGNDFVISDYDCSRFVSFSNAFGIVFASAIELDGLFGIIRGFLPRFWFLLHAERRSSHPGSLVCREMIILNRSKFDKGCES